MDDLLARTLILLAAAGLALADRVLLLCRKSEGDAAGIVTRVRAELGQG